jgi:hypothetical protein
MRKNMEKWIDSKAATLLKIKYDIEILQDYQDYLDNTPTCFPAWEDEDYEDGPMDFELWIEVFEQQIEYENSKDYQDELERLNEKD